MSYDLLALFLETPGTLMIAYAALRVHHRVLNEHKIDGKVFSIMKREQTVGKIGVAMVLIGFTFEIMAYFG
jgi:hypothetical protein